MLGSNPVKDWEKLGELDPYFGVLSSDDFRGRSLDADRLEKFYHSGEVHVREVFKIAQQQFSFMPHGKALDFGCGVGRLTCGMAPHFAEVFGLDISPGMLAKAQDRTERLALSNIRYVNPADGYVIPGNHFDFVHTYLVLQHMRVSDGERALGQMVHGLKNGGVGAVHFTYGHTRGRLYQRVRELAKMNAVSRTIGNVMLGRKWDSVTMLISSYSISRMIEILTENGIEKMFVHRIDDWGSLGLFLFFKKGPGAVSEWSNPVLP